MCLFVVLSPTRASAECATTEIDVLGDGTQCETAKFKVTTTSDTTQFSFEINAAGTFYIDWGDGSAVETISNATVDDAWLLHDYDDEGSYTIRLGGAATAYESNIIISTFVFGTSENIASVSGSLATLFPQFGSNLGEFPIFESTFYYATNLTSVPSGLFSGGNLVGGDNMFASTFYHSGLTSIPSGLFSGITSGADYMFDQTFAECTNLTTIPAGLFGSITSGAYSMFQYTFNGCTSLTAIPPRMFAGITTAASLMFDHTFNNCSSLSGYIPPSAFAGLIANNHPTASDMWSGAFSGTQLMTSCASPLTQYTSGYEGTGSTTWNGKVSCSRTCAAGEIDVYGDGSQCETAKFSITTTSNTTKFYFTMRAAGTFYVDWGDGSPVQILTYASAGNSTGVSHTFPSSNSYTIRFGGVGTSYGGYGHYSSTLDFTNNGWYQTNVASVSGSLGALFPQYGTAYGQYPSFYSQFSGCTNLTSISSTLFSGITGGVDNMFRDAFGGCTKLASIPAGLFDSVTTGGDSMFSVTFKGCTRLTGLPDNLFANITVSSGSLFSGTFQNCTGLTSLPENLFSGITTSASNLFYNTFNGCTALSGAIPLSTFSGLFNNNTPFTSGMFSGTFASTALNTSCGANEVTYAVYKPYWSGKVVCRAACPSGQIATGTTGCEAEKFSLTTTSDTTSFKFLMTAVGEFHIDWGDGSVQTIVRSNNNQATYSHTYSTAGAYTIRFGGTPTLYTTTNYDDYRGAAIGFYYPSTGTQAKIASVSGSLGAMFPILGSAENQNPKFSYTFMNATNLTTIPSGLFSGLTGSAYLFDGTFKGCTGLTTIAPDLFEDATTGYVRMFRYTFQNCTGLTTLPAGLFSYTTTSADRLFHGTFAGCTGLTALPENLFAGLTNATGYMFLSTFSGCTSLAGFIPPSLVSGLISRGSPHPQAMWSSAFANTALLTACPAGYAQYITGYEGTGDPRYWEGKVSCQTCAEAGLLTNTNGECEAPKLTLGIDATGTGAVSSRTYKFKLSAIGTFYVDWGDGSAPETIVRADTTETEYSHGYTNPGSYTVKLGGTATGYNTATNIGAISLDQGAAHVTSVSGSLGTMFPQNGTTAGTYPVFYRTFYNARLTSIPTTLFSGLTGAPHMFSGTFHGCSTLTEIPATLFSGITTSSEALFKETFRGCTTLTTVPANLFSGFTAGAPSLFEGTFQDCSGITSVPAGLFSSITSSSSTTKLFAFTFRNTGLTTIPAGLFNSVSVGAVHMFSNTFSNCGSLTSIPESLFSHVTTGASLLFFGTFAHTGISSIPAGLFATVTSTSDSTEMFNGTFAYCTSLTSIPETLFSHITTPATLLFYDTFIGDTALTTIPAGLFSYLSGGAYSLFSETFKNCTGLTSIPATLFSNVTTGYDNMFNSTFEGCRGLTSVPAGLFSSITTPAVYLFNKTFYNCSNMTGYIPASTFAGLIANDATKDTSMWYNTFYNTYVSTSCPSGTVQYITGYEGNTNNTTWNGRVSCQTCADAGWISAGTECIEPKFSVTTTNDTSMFKFQMSVKGTFYVDWGDGNVQTLEHANANTATYTHTYDTTGSYTIRFGGLATGYQTGNGPTITFYNETNGTQSKIAGISGSLAAIFPEIGTPTATSIGTHPLFRTTFEGAVNLTSIPDTLFRGLHGGYMMFYQTFYGCTGLTSIPATLFTDINIPAQSMFVSTFHNTGITSIPETLFDTVTSSEKSMFHYTFAGCSGLSSIPADLFSHITTGSDFLFDYTFAWCTGLTTVPATLFNRVTTGGESTFRGVFYGCTGLTSVPGNLFSGLTSTTGATDMFKGAFSGCTSLASVPATLFNKVSTGENYMFQETFKGCSALTTVPAELFSGISTGAKGLFYRTFENCTGLTSVPPGLFSGITTSAISMFSGTFKGCNHLAALPDTLFSGITTGANYMFNETFNGCSGLSGFVPPTLFSGLIANSSPTTTGFMYNIFYDSGYVTQCPVGYTQYITGYESSWSGRVSCVPCAAGTYKNATGNGACTACAAGTYSSTTGATACTACTNTIPTNASYSGTGGTTNACSWTCDSGYINTGTSCEVEKFSVTTTSDATTLIWTMSAAGEFYADCGDGGTLTQSGTTTGSTISGNKITRTGTSTITTYTCTWSSAGARTIRFGGTPTGYAGYPTTAISFYKASGGTQDKIVAIDGSLGALFPVVNSSVPGFKEAFRGTSITSIPAGLFSGITTGKRWMFYDTFADCTSLTTIPSGLFSGITNNEQYMFAGTFENCTSLTTIPSNLFSGLTRGAQGMFNDTFLGCTSLTTIPAGLFTNITTSVNVMFQNTFYGCTSLTTIPANLFSGITTGAAAMFSGTFGGCTSLTTIPSGLFSNITTGDQNLFEDTFSGCTSLTTIPANLFSGITAGAYGMFQHTFDGCTSLTTIPAGLFTNITTGERYLFAETFYNCTGLTTIPANLFSGITSTTGADNMFQGTFHGCSSLTTIPSGLFSKVTTGANYMFSGTFLDCTSLTTIPSGLFSSITSAAAYMFNSTFYGCTNLAGFIPPDAFAGLIANNSPTTSYMWWDAFYNTQLVTTCPAGYTQYITGYEGSGTSTWNGKVSCTPCAAGTYKNTVGNGACTACANGTYSSTTGATACTACTNKPANSVYTGNATSNSCPYGCNAGYGHGDNSCVACAAGTYKGTVGNEACTAASAGYFAEGTANTTQTLCVAGSYTDTTGQAECSACQNGTTNTGTDATSQQACGTTCSNATNARTDNNSLTWETATWANNSVTNACTLKTTGCAANYYYDTNACVSCPTPADHKRTTFPANYYEPTIDSVSFASPKGISSISSCRVIYWASGTRGRLYDYSTYNTTTSKYDTSTNYGWSDVNAGYYLTTKGSCGTYAYYKDANVCPAGSYCPGKARVTCNASNQETVHTTTFGLNDCATDTTNYANSAEGTTTIDNCYLTTTATNYVATAGAGETTCAAGGYCAGGVNIYYGGTHDPSTHPTTGGRTDCPANSFCVAGVSAATACSTLGGGLYTKSAAGSDEDSDCYFTTTAGKYLKASTNTALTACAKFYYCPATTLYYPTYGATDNADNIVDGIYNCPAISSTTTMSSAEYPNWFYNISSVTTSKYNGTSVKAVTGCRIYYTVTNERGKQTTAFYYNSTTGKYDTFSFKYYTKYNPGYYGNEKYSSATYCNTTTNYMYHKDALPCPAGSYCPGLTSIPKCDNADYTWADTIGIYDCATDTTNYPNSVALSSKIGQCYLTTTSTNYVATAGAGETSCLAGGYCAGGTDVYYNTDGGAATGGMTVCAANSYSNASASSCTACATTKGYGNSGDDVANHAGVTSCAVTCPGGSYVATAGAGCVNVGAGNWGAGGTVTQTGTLARTSCATGLTTIGYGPGADEAADCGHKFHAADGIVYLRSVKKTTPSLNVRIGNDVFYGNMSTTTKNMSDGVTRKLKVKNGNTTYWVHDDSVDGT